MLPQRNVSGPMAQVLHRLHTLPLRQHRSHLDTHWPTVRVSPSDQAQTQRVLPRKVDVRIVAHHRSIVGSPSGS
jgi:hypothetical protein